MIEQFANTTERAGRAIVMRVNRSNSSGHGCSGLLCGWTASRQAVEKWPGWRNAQSKLDRIEKSDVWEKMPWATSTSTTTTTSSTTTTTTTTTWCMEEVVEGDLCYQEVIKTMYAIQANPDSFDGVNEWSPFEEVQDYLYYQSFGAYGNESRGGNMTACWKSCPCQTAKVGSECYDDVIWAMNVGFFQAPDNYSNASEYSPFEQFQELLWRGNSSNCSKPCRAPWSGGPSLFCWSVSRRWGYDNDIMTAQLTNGAGIFACDGFAVLSEEDWVLGRGPGGRIGEVRTVRFEGAWVGTSSDGTAGNARLFMNAWDAVTWKTTALKHDWILKADPDAVIVADRLREHLGQHTGQSAFVRNCNGWPQSSDYPMAFGSLEAITKEGLKVYRDSHERCKEIFAAWWESWGEDLFMGKCLPQLGVSAK